MTRKYNLSSKTWTSLAQLPTNQSFTWGTTAEVIGDSIYLVNPAGLLYRYAIPTNTWSELPSAGITGTSDLSSIVYNGEMYVIGFRDSTFAKYSPQSGTWTTLAKSFYQVGACAMGIVNDQIYCVGGNLNGGTGAFYNSVIAYILRPILGEQTLCEFQAGGIGWRARNIAADSMFWAELILWQFP